MSASSPVDNSAEEDAKAETAALIKELKEQLQKAEASTEEFKKQVEVLKTRLDDALKDQAKLEERMHEEEERVEILENEKRETVRQRRELEGIYEAERAAAMKEKEQAQAREDELQEIIQRLKDTLAERDREGTPSGEERRNSRISFPTSRTNSSQNLENGHFAPPASLQRSNSQNSSKLILQKDKLIESLRLELAEAQIKAIEMENAGGGRVQELEKVLLETRMANARLMEDNESFQLLLSEKTLNGDFMRSIGGITRPSSQGDGDGDRPNTSLADELGAAADEESNERRLETEINSLKDQNKALTLYINKIIERLLQHQGFEAVLSHDQDAAPAKPAGKENPPPPPPKDKPQGQSFLQRAKSVALGSGGSGPQQEKRPRPMSVMPPPPPKQEDSGITSDPATAPSIPLRHGSGQHRRANSEWSNSAATVVNNMYRNTPRSPSIVSPRNSFFNFPQGEGPASNRSSRVVSSSSVPRQSVDGNGDSAGQDTISNTDSGVAVDTPSPPRSVASSFDRPGGNVMTGNKPRPLRLVQESEEAENERKKANRQSWIGAWFNKNQNSETA
ncbi:m serotype precursor [Neofusicoccum parvum]|uniref:M serotype n=1 Tax=Neofusicoccum parvum TaxID=310453 RepID=A0ACB5SIT4_9PEZI|nr:m serotype precursor [Neofusicoccum parvum]